MSSSTSKRRRATTSKHYPSKITKLSLQDALTKFDGNASPSSRHSTASLDESNASSRDHYSVFADEVKEDEDLVVIGEDSSVDDDSTIPIRGFNEFVVYHEETMALVDIANLIAVRDCSSLEKYRASGFVTPWTEDEDVDEDVEAASDQGQYVQLACIRQLNFFHYSRKSLDRKIYIETKYAWYILQEPSAQYQPFFQNFWLKHRTTHFLLSESLENMAMDKEQFLESLKLYDEYPSSVIQRIQAGIEDEDLRAFALGAILELPININHVPVIRQIFGELPDIDSDDEENAGPASPKCFYSETVVTKAVLQVCRRLFPQRQKFKLCDRNNTINRISQSQCLPCRDFQTEIHSASPKITWRTKSSVESRYTSVLIDSTLYSIGDVVIVERGEDNNETRDRNSDQKFSKSINTLANSKWFARISYMFEGSNGKFFHGQWLQHGSQTILQEAAHPSVLFSMLECDDMPLESIYMKCNLRTPEHDDDLVLPDYNPQSENDFICSLTWDERRSAFVDFSQVQINRALQYCRSHEQCFSCGISIQDEESNIPLFVKPDIVYRGVTFRKDDFAYIINDLSDLYTIGQVIYIGGNLMVAFRVYKRCKKVKRPFDEVGGSPTLTNVQISLLCGQVRLSPSDDILTVPARMIEGLCWVKLESDLTCDDEIRAWLSKEDHFLIVESDQQLITNGIGLQTHEHELQHREHLLQENTPLKGLELFAGAGGFGTGLDFSGFVKTLWAVEWDLSAAATFRENHPETLVFNHDCNVFLASAMQGTALECVEGEFHALPQPGEVDIIFGGPPCQAFSGMNHWRDPNDPRITLVCNMISYVDYYRPSYFILENVERMLDYPVGAELDGQRLVGGVKKGILKFILASLTSIGFLMIFIFMKRSTYEEFRYQVHFRVLQAGRYAVPQNRERVIFLAAKRGVPLPQFPLPSHVFKRRAGGKNLANGSRLNPVTRRSDSNLEGHICSCAPMPAITVDDCLNDLPSFDWYVENERAGMKFTCCLGRIPMSFVPERIKGRRSDALLEEFRSLAQ